MTPIRFHSRGVECAATHYASGDHDGRPIVVMAHGLAGTQDSGLAPFAEAFAAAGMDALTFDYRGFGLSGGEPRQAVSLAGQLDDLRAAMAAARRLPGVDPERLVLWGISLGGGHVVSAAADGGVAVVISAVPMVDGLAAAKLAARHHAPTQLLRSTATGIASKLRTAAGGSPAMIPVVARPGQTGALTLAGAYEDYLAVAGPTWRNEIAADVVMELGSRQAAKDAARLNCPWLVQIADFDRSAPPYAAAKAAFRGRAEVRHYPCDHFDLFPGKPWHQPAVDHAVGFLHRHLHIESGVLVG